MKKINQYAMLCIVLITGITMGACKKSDDKPKPKTPPGPEVGYWYGSFVNNNGAGAAEGILFRSDGTLKMYDFYGAISQTDTTQNALNATGKYTITGNTIAFSYSFGNEYFTAQGTINKSVSPATISYNFTDPNSVALSGTGSVTQQSN